MFLSEPWGRSSQFIGFLYNADRYRGVVKWYHEGLQNLYSGFEPLRPCQISFTDFRGGFFLLEPIEFCFSLREQNRFFARKVVINI